ncbi:unnamed protein product [Lota lota]
MSNARTLTNVNEHVAIDLAQGLSLLSSSWRWVRARCRGEAIHACTKGVLFNRKVQQRAGELQTLSVSHGQSSYGSKDLLPASRKDTPVGEQVFIAHQPTPVAEAVV